MPDGRQPPVAHLAVRRAHRGRRAARAGAVPPRGHLVYAARGVLSVHTERGTSIVPANRVAWTPPVHPPPPRATARPTCGSSSCRRPWPGSLPSRPAVFTASDLAREVLLGSPARATTTAPARPRRAAAPGPRRRAPRGPEQPLQLPEPATTGCAPVARILGEPRRQHLARRARADDRASARTLSRLFHDELGMTYYEWRTQLRVYHALVLLAEGHDTTHVAHACGWANPSHFIAAFAELVGTTPGRHRRSVDAPGDVRSPAAPRTRAAGRARTPAGGSAPRPR
jgi:AraC-like DNA-binding protein